MAESKLKDAGAFVVGILGLGLMFAIAGLFLWGMLWVVSKLLPLVMFLSGLGLLILIPVLPAAIIKRARPFCGNAVYFVSWVWGAALWMWATLILFELWGTTGLILGFLLLGFGSVPLACVALLFKGEFLALLFVIIAVVVVLGVRILGIWILAKADHGDQYYEIGAGE